MRRPLTWDSEGKRKSVRLIDTLYLELEAGIKRMNNDLKQLDRFDQVRVR